MTSRATKWVFIGFALFVSNGIAEYFWIHSRCRKVQTHLLVAVLDEWNRESESKKFDEVVLTQERQDLLERYGVSFSILEGTRGYLLAETHNGWFLGEQIQIVPESVRLLDVL